MNLSILSKEIAPFNLYKVLWKLVLWTLRVIIILIAVPVGILLMILQIGFLSDLAVTPWWVKAQRESQEYFSKLKDYRYQAADLTFTVREENAWDYYNRASQWLYDIEDEDREVIQPYSFDQHKPTLSDTERVIKRYASAFAIWDSGTACRYCAIPMDYEQGIMKPLPPSLGLERLADLALVCAKAELAKGNSLKAAEIYTKVLKMGADIGGGQEEIGGRMAEVRIRERTEERLRIEINSFNLEALVFLEDALPKIEANWPPFDRVLEAEGRTLLLPSSSGWDGMKLYEVFMTNDDWTLRQPLHLQILHRIGYDLVSLKRGFSGRLTSITTSRRVVNLANQLNAVQKRDWENLQPILVRADSEVNKDNRHWDIAVVPLRNRLWFYPFVYPRIYRSLITMRVIEKGYRLREYRLKNKRFPDNLESFLASDTTYYDLANSKPLHFLRDSTGQTIRLYSIGLNLKDEKGEGNPENWAGGSEKDDIWVEVK